MTIGLSFACADHEKNVCSRLRRRISSVPSRAGVVALGAPLAFGTSGEGGDYTTRRGRSAVDGAQDRVDGAVRIGVAGTRHGVHSPDETGVVLVTADRISPATASAAIA
jgi:hypothetical protein